MAGPSTYKVEYADMLIDHMAQGYCFQSFAGVVGVTRGTLNYWLKKYPDFKEARDIGYMKLMLFLRIYLIKMARGKVKGNLKVLQLFYRNVEKATRPRQEQCPVRVIVVPPEQLKSTSNIKTEGLDPCHTTASAKLSEGTSGIVAGSVLPLKLPDALERTHKLYRA